MRVNKGDKVIWRGSWGTGPADVVKLIAIEITEKEFQKEGIETDGIFWDELDNEWTCPFIATLDNGHWAYSYQLQPERIKVVKI